MMLLRHIPNALTLLNALLGVLAITYLLKFNDPEFACILVLFAAMADVLDGFLARLLNVTGPLGAQLDSLADAITFGAFPAFLALTLLIESSADPGVWQVIPLLIAPASVYRLAKFNLDTRQHFGFIGFPTPAITLLWIGVYMSTQTAMNNSFLFLSEWFESSGFILTLSVLSAWLLNASIPLLSLKIVNGKMSRGQRWLIVGSLGLYSLIALSSGNFWLPLPFVLLLYFILSLIFTRKTSLS
jgi:CDP-diacylglycerol--serine O-phosphatidyltransferase